MNQRIENARKMLQGRKVAKYVSDAVDQYEMAITKLEEDLRIARSEVSGNATGKVVIPSYSNHEADFKLPDRSTVEFRLGDDSAVQCSVREGLLEVRGIGRRSTICTMPSAANSAYIGVVDGFREIGGR